VEDGEWRLRSMRKGRAGITTEVEEDTMRLKGLKTIVTGGGGERGIGRAIVRAFGREGADVCVVGLNVPAGRAAADEVRAYGGQAMSMRCDVSKYDEIQAAVDAVLREWGRIDVLVNNAGVSLVENFVDITPEQMQRVFNINYFGSFFMQQAVVRHMVQRSREVGYKPGDKVVGRIINHSSISEHVGARLLSAYSPTKAAIMMLTKCTALELAERGIVVNALGTGYVLTNIGGKYATVEAYEVHREATPIKRIGTQAEIANVAVFLASGESDYITGTTIICDGGYTAQ
jgi:NAD(P)-dependent dehydrogenase (short-subunit alcohol dehydrogenase family)